MPLSQEQIEKAKEAVQLAIASLIAKNPFLGMLLRKTWIYVSDCDDTAFTDGLKIILCYDYFMNLGNDIVVDNRKQVFVLVHELLHIIFKHTVREKYYVEKYKKMLPPLLLNIVADAKVNQYAMELDMMKSLRMDVITPEWLEHFFGVENVREKSFEEILDELTRKIKTIKIKCRNCPPGDGDPVPTDEDVDADVEIEVEVKDKRGSETVTVKPPKMPRDVFREGKEEKGKGEQRVPINEGDKEDLEAEGKGEEEIERRWQKKIAESLITAKMAGTLPAGWERLISELLKPEVDWKRLLMTVLTKGLGRKVKRTWSRPSRKLPDLYPGKETLKQNKVVVLIDTSGSIGEKELQKFVSEVYGIAKESSEVIVIPWDAEAYQPIIIRRYSDVKKIRTLQGGGGTCIKPALELVDKQYKNADMIIIFSDWEIFDLNSTEVQQLLRKYAPRIIAFTTYNKPPAYLRNYKIKIE